jgi:hypothetical protein
MTEPPRTVASITRKGRAPQTHAYDDPNLSAKEFLLTVMRDTTLPLSTRIKAARDVRPYFIADPRPVAPVTCRIIIPSLDEEFILGSGQGPSALMNESGTDNTISQSKSRIRSDSHQPRCGGPGPPNIETTSNPPTLIDYSKPPTPEDIQQIKAVVHTLRPDFAALPSPELHLCACGHWIFGPCPCPRPQSLN